MRQPQDALFLRRSPLLMAVALAAGALSAGCQSVVSSGPMGFAARRQEQKIEKQAANDPFPSPSEVGLGSMNKTL